MGSHAAVLAGHDGLPAGRPAAVCCPAAGGPAPSAPRTLQVPMNMIAERHLSSSSCPSRCARYTSFT